MATKKERRLIKNIADALPEVVYSYEQVVFTNASRTHFRKVTKHAPVNHYRRLVKIFDSEGFKGIDKYIAKMTSIGTAIKKDLSNERT